LTARDLIRRSLTLIGILAEGENPSADQLADGITSLNDMLGSWSTENLLINSIVREVFSLVAGQDSYSIGTGGDFDTARPVMVEKVAFLDNVASPNIETQMVLLAPSQWADISSKALSGQPQKAYLEGTNPLETMRLWPVPDSARQVVLYSQKPLLTIASGNTSIDLPPGYSKALRYNLAIELAPEYGRSCSAEVVTAAAESKSNVKRLNMATHLLTSDLSSLGGGRFNILTGE
jgi:hypothetical protein